MNLGTMNDLFVWSWIFSIGYIVLMIGIGFFSGKKISTGDDYAVARGGYGPVVLSLAFAATIASGVTFLGLPGMAYSLGLPALWYPALYPLAIYMGVLFCLKAVSSGGEEFGSRSIPEYLGNLYQSEFIRVAYAAFSLMLVFYLAGQLVAGLVIFERLLGLPDIWALILTTVVLLVYVLLGGAHADIISDSVQGVSMVLIAILTIFLFMRGVNIDGEMVPVMEALATQGKEYVATLKPGHATFGSPLTIFLLIFAHIPLGMLPHIGNKLWALKSGRDRKLFLGLAFFFAMILVCMSLGGLLARAMMGDDLIAKGFSANEAIPVLFIEIMPAWLAALLCVAILSAIMSTADGLVVSASQVFANDIYRCSIAPRWHKDLTPEQLEKRVLVVSRYATVAVLIGSAALAWSFIGVNVAVIVFLGVGGMSAALAGPLIVGSQWSAVTKQAAISGMLVGAGGFVLLFSGVVTNVLNLPETSWLAIQSSNAFICSGMCVIASITVTFVVTLFTKKANS